MSFKSSAKRVLLYPFHKINAAYLGALTKWEYTHPPFTQFNERPVEYRFVFEQLSEFYPKNVLDVGTGKTALPHLMANCGSRVTAVDNIKDYWTEDYYNRHYYIINDDITKTKLPANTFDMVTCISTLEHIKAFREALRSMFFVLKPSGLLVLTCPYNENRYAENVYKLPGSNAPAGVSFTTQAFSRKELDDCCRENGAEILKQEYWQFYKGEYWTVGKRLIPPKKSSKDQAHQISCILLKKI